MAENRCPFATPASLPYDAGPMRGGGDKIVHHTTEGSSYAGALGAYRSVGVAPHFTDTYEDGQYRVYQHIPLNLSSTALRHPSGPETNRACSIQIEHVGRASETGSWAKGYYDGIAKLCRWIEQQTGCPRSHSGCSFSTPHRMGGQEFFDYRGHCGHVHAPGNDHTDPGTGFKIDLVLANNGDPCAFPGTVLKNGSRGGDVKTLQRRLNKVRNTDPDAGQPKLDVDGDFGPGTDKRVRQFQRHHDLDVDGSVGAKTWRRLCKEAQAR